MLFYNYFLYLWYFYSFDYLLNYEIILNTFNSKINLKKIKKMLNGSNLAPKPSPESIIQSKQDLARLIDYYRLVVETFETERIKNHDLFQSIKIPNEDQHKVEWEIKRRKDEIIELENALHESNMALNNERKRAIHYGKVIENCKYIAKEDKRRIKQLLELSEPI